MGEDRQTGFGTLDQRIAIASSFGEIAVTAGREILQIRARALNVRTKADSSPVTEADEKAEVFILNALEAVCSGIPVAAEEAVASGRRPHAASEFLLVDPLDGTREFVAGLDEFTVNIALIRDGYPVAGAVYAPASGQLWCGATGADGQSKAWTCHINQPDGEAVIGQQSPISTRKFLDGTATALVSRAYKDPRADAFIAAAGIKCVRAAGSSLKFCLIAEGFADLYPRFGPTNEWDIAAGDAVLRAAGGLVLDVRGQPLVYGNKDFASPHFIAVGERAAAQRLAAVLS